MQHWCVRTVFSDGETGNNAGMANIALKGTRIAILVAEAFEEIEMTKTA